MNILTSSLSFSFITKLFQKYCDAVDMGFFKIDESSESTSFTEGMILALILVAASYVISYLAIHKLHWTFVSEAAVALLVGICAGGFLYAVDRTEGFQMSIFYDILLPPVIFSSGFSMSRRWFFSNIYPILGYALVGTVISTFLTGLLLWAIAQTSALDLNIDIKAALAFGSLISATDPVTTLAIFQELKVESKLFYIIFGESVFNDAVAIVLFETLKQTMQGTEISIGVAVGKFFFVFISSMILGGAFGCLSALVFKHAKFGDVSVEMVLLMLFFYVPYLVGEVFSVSGIVAILFTGITMKHYTHRNLSAEASDLSEIIVSLIASVSETFIFLNLGTSVWTMSNVSISFVVWSLVIILLARAGQVYPLSFLFNALARNKSEHLEPNQMHMLWYSGLRGAIAFALAMDFPEESGISKEVKSCTMILVLITILTFGTATVPTLKCLGIRQKTGSHRKEKKSAAVVEEDESKRSSRIDSSRFVPMHPHCLNLLEFDRRYVQPCLVRDSRIGKPQDDVAVSSRASKRLSAPFLRDKRVSNRTSCETQIVEAEEVEGDGTDLEEEMLATCGNRGSLRNLGRLGGRWWMRSIPRSSKPAQRRIQSMAFSELRNVAERVLAEGRPRFATRSMLIRLLESTPIESDDDDATSGGGAEA